MNGFKQAAKVSAVAAAVFVALAGTAQGAGSVSYSVTGHTANDQSLSVTANDSAEYNYFAGWLNDNFGLSKTTYTDPTGNLNPLNEEERKAIVDYWNQNAVKNTSVWPYTYSAPNITKDALMHPVPQSQTPEALAERANRVTTVKTEIKADRTAATEQAIQDAKNVAINQAFDDKEALNKGKPARHAQTLQAEQDQAAQDAQHIDQRLTAAKDEAHQKNDAEAQALYAAHLGGSKYETPDPKKKGGISLAHDVTYSTDPDRKARFMDQEDAQAKVTDQAKQLAEDLQIAQADAKAQRLTETDPQALSRDIAQGEAFAQAERVRAYPEHGAEFWSHSTDPQAVAWRKAFINTAYNNDPQNRADFLKIAERGNVQFQGEMKDLSGKVLTKGVTFETMINDGLLITPVYKPAGNSYADQNQALSQHKADQIHAHDVAQANQAFSPDRLRDAWIAEQPDYISPADPLANISHSQNLLTAAAPELNSQPTQVQRVTVIPADPVRGAVINPAQDGQKIEAANRLRTADQRPEPTHSKGTTQGHVTEMSALDKQLHSQDDRFMRKAVFANQEQKEADRIQAKNDTLDREAQGHHSAEVSNDSGLIDNVIAVNSPLIIVPQPDPQPTLIHNDNLLTAQAPQLNSQPTQVQRVTVTPADPLPQPIRVPALAGQQMEQFNLNRTADQKPDPDLIAASNLGGSKVPQGKAPRGHAPQTQVSTLKAPYAFKAWKAIRSEQHAQAPYVMRMINMQSSGEIAARNEANRLQKIADNGSQLEQFNRDRTASQTPEILVSDLSHQTADPAQVAVTSKPGQTAEPLPQTISTAPVIEKDPSHISPTLTPVADDSELIANVQTFTAPDILLTDAPQNVSAAPVGVISSKPAQTTDSHPQPVTVAPVAQQDPSHISPVLTPVADDSTLIDNVQTIDLKPITVQPLPQPQPQTQTADDSTLIANIVTVNSPAVIVPQPDAQPTVTITHTQELLTAQPPELNSQPTQVQQVTVTPADPLPQVPAVPPQPQVTQAQVTPQAPVINVPPLSPAAIGAGLTQANIDRTADQKPDGVAQAKTDDANKRAKEDADYQDYVRSQIASSDRVLSMHPDQTLIDKSKLPQAQPAAQPMVTPPKLPDQPVPQPVTQGQGYKTPSAPVTPAEPPKPQTVTQTPVAKVPAQPVKPAEPPKPQTTQTQTQPAYKTPADPVKPVPQKLVTNSNVQTGTKQPQAITQPQSVGNSSNSGSGTAQPQTYTSPQPVVDTYSKQQLNSYFVNQSLYDQAQNNQLIAESHARAEGDRQTLQQANNYTDQKVGSLSNEVKKNKREANAGIAGVIALTQIPQVGSDPFSFGAGIGTQGGQTAVSMGSRQMWTQHIGTSVGVTYSQASGVGAGAGIAIGFGQ